MVGRRALWGVMAWLLVGLLLGTPVTAACQESEGVIALPWGPMAPTSTDGLRALHEILVYEIVEFGPGQDFSLRPVDSQEILCVNNQCVHHTDYNVAFYREGDLVDTLVEAFDDPGPVDGEVPADVDYALVWMRTGTSAPLVGGTLSVDDRFSWSVGC